MNSSIEHNPSLRLAGPVKEPLYDGVVFALRNAVALIFLSFGPAAIKVAASYFPAAQPLAARELFLVFVVFTFADCWLAASVAMYVFERGRGTVQPLAALSAQALNNLPKVLLSCGVVLGIAVVSSGASGLGAHLSTGGRMMLAALFLLTLFLTWAPFFVIGELYSKPSNPEEEEEEEGYFDDEEGFYAPPRPQQWFTGMSALELGFERSLLFSFKFFGPTLEFLMLLWLARIAPLAFGKLVFGPYDSYASSVFDAALSSMSSAFALAAGTYLFVTLLPREARSEVGISPHSELLTKGGQGGTRGGRRVFVGAVFCIAAVCTWYWAAMVGKQLAIPNEAGVKVEQAVRDADSVQIRLRIEDREHALRWLQATGFQLEVGKGAEKHPKQRWIEPEEVTVRDEQGADLGDDYSPRYGPVVVDLTYRLGENAAKRTLSLRYRTITGEGKVLHVLPSAKDAAQGDGE